MSTPDAENAPLLRAKRSERSSVLSFAKTSGASRLDVCSFVYSRLYYTPVASSRPEDARVDDTRASPRRSRR